MTETAVVITVPDGATRVLVRLPGAVASDDVQVDFKGPHNTIWTPCCLTYGTFEVEVSA